MHEEIDLRVCASPQVRLPMLVDDDGQLIVASIRYCVKWIIDASKALVVVDRRLCLAIGSSSGKSAVIASDGGIANAVMMALARYRQKVDVDPFARDLGIFFRWARKDGHTWLRGA